MGSSSPGVSYCGCPPSLNAFLGLSSELGRNSAEGLVVGFADDGRPRASIFYLAHLDDAQRAFFITLFLGVFCFLLYEPIGKLFSRDPEVLTLFSSIFWIVTNTSSDIRSLHARPICKKPCCF